MSYSENITKIIDSIFSQVSYLIKGAKFDKTFKAKVIGKVSDGKYQILYKGKKYYVTCKTSLSTNDIVKVCAPQNNWSELFVVNDSVGNSGSGSTIAGVSGVKGNAETAYRDGNVNITPTNIGLGNVDNTADRDKSVFSATRLTTPRTINDVLFDGTEDIYITDPHISVTKAEYESMLANGQINDDSYYFITDDEENILNSGTSPDNDSIIIDDNGKLVADNANDSKKLGGQSPSYYAKESDVVKKSNVSDVHVNDTDKVPSSALVNSMQTNINNKANSENPNLIFELSNGTTVDLRKSGATDSLCVSLVPHFSDGSTQFHSLIDSSGNFLPNYVKILNIKYVAFTASEVIDNLKSKTITTTYTSVSGADNYLIIPLKCNYGIVTDSSYSNGTISITVLNISGATHTMAGLVGVVAYKNRK